MKRKTKKIITGVLIGLLTVTTVGLIAHEVNESNGWFDKIVERHDTKLKVDDNLLGKTLRMDFKGLKDNFLNPEENINLIKGYGDDENTSFSIMIVTSNRFICKIEYGPSQYYYFDFNLDYEYEDDFYNYTFVPVIASQTGEYTAKAFKQIIITEINEECEDLFSYVY